MKTFGGGLLCLHLLIASCVLLSILVQALRSKPSINEQKAADEIKNNTEKYPPKQKEEKVIIFIGDSITEG